MANAKNINSSYVYRLISANTTNSTLVNGYPSRLMGLHAFNLNASPAYLKIYNKATAPTVGTDTPAMTIILPGVNTVGNPVAIPIPAEGLYFDLGLGFGLTTALADNSTSAVAANEVVVNVIYDKG